MAVRTLDITVHGSEESTNVVLGMTLSSARVLIDFAEAINKEAKNTPLAPTITIKEKRKLRTVESWETIV